MSADKLQYDRLQNFQREDNRANSITIYTLPLNLALTHPPTSLQCFHLCCFGMGICSCPRKAMSLSIALLHFVKHYCQKKSSSSISYSRIGVKSACLMSSYARGLNVGQKYISLIIIINKNKFIYIAPFLCTQRFIKKRVKLYNQ